MPRRRQQHDLLPLSKLGYPKRFLFIDSESYVPREDPMNTAVGGHWEGLMAPHEPRLICAEYWVASDSGYDNRTTVRSASSHADVSAMPQGIPYSEEETDPARGGGLHRGFYYGEERLRTPAVLCRAFWEDTSALAKSGRTYGQTHLPLTVVGHNIGYDMLATGAYTHLPALGWTMEYPYSKGPVYICKFTSGQSVIIVLSSTNFFISPLKVVAKNFRTEKLEMDDFNTTDIPKLLGYCRRDVEIVSTAMRWLTLLLKNDRLGPFKMTLSSIAFACWRYRFLTHQIRISVDPDASALERRAYFGGRTEEFYAGLWDGELFGYDVNALYASVMANKPMPTRFVSMRTDVSIRELEEMVGDGIAVIAEVKVAIETNSLPIRGDGLLFLIGDYSTVLCTPELRIAIREGRITAVGKVAVYDSAPIFRDFIAFFSERRIAAERDSRLAERMLYKGMANHVYGKFGQRSADWEQVAGPIPEDCPGPPFVVRLRVPDTNRYVHASFNYRVGTSDRISLPDRPSFIATSAPSGIYAQSAADAESFNAFPAIAAFITSYARARLWSLICTANGRDGRHVLYTDTDSLFVDGVGSRRLEESGEVDAHQTGKLKREWRGIRANITGAKAYRVIIDDPEHGTHEPTQSCPKGIRLIPATHRRPGEPADEEMLVSTLEPHYYAKEAYKGIGAHASRRENEEGTPVALDMQWPTIRGHLTGAHDISVFRNRRITKRMDTPYTKSIPPPNGVGWCHPYRMPEDALAGRIPGITLRPEDLV